MCVRDRELVYISPKELITVSGFCGLELKPEECDKASLLRPRITLGVACRRTERMYRSSFSFN